MSSPSEEEEKKEDDQICHPAIVMVDEQSGNQYMRIVDQKGIGNHQDTMGIVKDMHVKLKAWGKPGGDDNIIVLTSDGETSIVAVRAALAQLHGGVASPEQFLKG